MKNQQRSFSEEEIRALMSQVLQGLAHVHKHEYFHRDLKPGIDILKLLCSNGLPCSGFQVEAILDLELILFDLSTCREFTGYK